MSVDWKLWLVVGGLGAALLGQFIFSAVCPFMSPKAEKWCQGFSSVLAAAGDQVEGVGLALAPDAGVSPFQIITPGPYIVFSPRPDGGSLFLTPGEVHW